ncbi:NAD(P)/FAD-dependent oxidoreductase [Leadbetterella sp. DM7]|uniref:NAD(P)/FAD-dependent oxidoreductase n=1 Tax=Leadbetterella sp. DM7 TaxID=3235085 RepID=UPI00349ED00C
MKKEEVDVLVIGAGPSGCVASAYLSNHGVRVKVVEKSKFPRFVIGESFLPRSMEHYEEAGLLEALKAKNFEIKAGARFIRGKETCFFDFSNKFGEGWDWTWQAPRADFDHTLAQEVIRKGVDVEFETEVLDVSFKGTDSVTTVRNKDGETYEIGAKFIIDSSGYGRVLPRLLDLDMPSDVTENSAIFTHVKDDGRVGGDEGTLITFDILETQVWFWVIPFSNGNTSLGVVGPTKYIEKLPEDPGEALREAIRRSDYYRDRYLNTEFIFKPHRIKNYSCSVKQNYGPGFTLTGNSAGFLDPVFSSGVCFATESALLSAKLFLKERAGEPVNWEKEYSDYIKRGVNVFSTYVKEWYTGNLQTLFFHQPENPDVKRKICAVLAGYVWNEENPFVQKHDRVIKSMAYLLQNGGSVDEFHI